MEVGNVLTFDNSLKIVQKKGGDLVEDPNNFLPHIQQKVKAKQK